MKRYFILITLLISLGLPLMTHAQSCSLNRKTEEITLEQNNLDVGEETKINITNQEDYQINYTVKDNDILLVSEGIVKALKYGETNIIVTLVLYENEEIIDSCTSTLPVRVSSSDATLMSLTLDEYDLSQEFKPNVYNYQITLSYPNEIVNISAIANNEKAIVNGTGNFELKVGLNEFKIRVQSESGNKSTYTLSIYRENASDNTLLNSLIVEGFVLSPKFDSHTYKYILNVTEETNDIMVKATAHSQYAKVSGIGKHELASGKNIIYVTVKAQNGDESKYELEVNKTLGSSRLQELNIEGYELSPQFTSDNFNYEITISNDVSHLDIVTNQNDDDSIEIMGNDNFQVGENVVYIKITSKDKSPTTYKINVIKKEATKNNNLVKILFVLFVGAIILMVSLIGVFIYRNHLINFKKREK